MNNYLREFPEFASSDMPTFEGDTYKALYIESNVSTVDWKSLAKDLGISADVIAKYTKTSARFSIKVDAK